MSKQVEVIKFNHKIVIKEPEYESICAKVHILYKYQSPSDIAHLHEALGRHLLLQRSFIDSINDTYLSHHGCMPAQEIDFSPVLTQTTEDGLTTISVDFELKMLAPKMSRAYLIKKLTDWVRYNFLCYIDAVKVTIDQF